ncbi:MAG: S9 family peptidase [Candidatus Thermoplasmatota archaeon]|nr:S9 family peptidase [Candidatus Thermoplasmatota archaeon]
MSGSSKKDKKYPKTKHEDVEEELHGVNITDPYRWLEEDSEEVQEWTEEQNEYTEEILDDSILGTLRPHLELVVEHEEYGTPVVRGDRYFQLLSEPDEDQRKLVVREEPDGEYRILADPNEFEGVVSLDWFVPSPDGDLIVYGKSEGGTEQYDLTVLDVEDDSEVMKIPDVGRCGEQTVAWLDDGFYYQKTDPEDQLDKELRYAEIDGKDHLITDDLPRKKWPILFTDQETDTTLVGIGELGGETELYLLKDGLTRILPELEASIKLLLHRGRCYLLTDHETSRWKVLSCPIEELEDITTDELDTTIPETEKVLMNIVPAKDRLVVHSLKDAVSSISIHSLNGEHLKEIDLPLAGIPRGELTGNDKTREAYTILQSFDRPPEVIQINADSYQWNTIDSVQIPGDLPDLTVDRIWVGSTDGKEVPAFITHRADIEPNKSPTVLYGYGGFRIPLTPDFKAVRLPFLEAGGVWVQACLRGGLEFGEEWHEEGMRENKQQVFDDYYSVAEHLIRSGISSEDQLAAWGGSNGGLLVATAITQRPELFAGAICAVPLTDMLRFHRTLLGATWTKEYGSPEDVKTFKALKEYSPYHNIEKRTYPPTLIRTAVGDTRVDPAHARKFAARLQKNQTDDAPICLWTEIDTGHGLGKPTSMIVEQSLHEFGFLFKYLDIDVSTLD